MAPLALGIPVVLVDSDLAAATGTVSLQPWKIIIRHKVFSTMAAGAQCRSRRDRLRRAVRARFGLPIVGLEVLQNDADLLR